MTDSDIDPQAITQSASEVLDAEGNLLRREVHAHGTDGEPIERFVTDDPELLAKLTAHDGTPATDA